MNENSVGNQISSNLTPRVRVIPPKSRNTMTAENPNGQKKRIAIYARVSTSNEEQMTSYDLQLSYFTDYVNSNPAWVLIDTYADEGISGTSTKNRTEFNRMIEDAKNKKFDYIITKSISRFARNTLDCLSYIRMLKSLDIGVLFQKENIDTLDSKSEFLLTILSSIAQEESRSVSENTRWGVQKRFQQGKIHCPTIYFLGYDTDKEGNIVVNEEQAKVVKRIFKEFMEGKGTPTIAKGLMKDGVLTARGKPKWTSDTVCKILKQEKYTGHCLAQKSVTLDFLTHKRVRNKNIQPQYFIKNALPQIIPEEEWNAVQQELKRRNQMLHDPDKKYKMTYSSLSPFSNKLFCGECGRTVNRRRLTSNRKGKPYPFSAWQCKNSSCHCKGPRDCKARYIWETDLEKTFMKLLYDMKENKDAVISDAQAAITACSLTDIEQLRLEELESQIGIIANRISEMSERGSSSNDAIYDATIRHLIYEQEILQSEYDGLVHNKQESIYLENQLNELLKYLNELEEPINMEYFRDDIFKKTIERGILYNSHQINFEFKCGINRMIGNVIKR